MFKKKKIILPIAIILAIIISIIITFIMLRDNDNKQPNENIENNLRFTNISDVIEIDKSKLLPTDDWETYKFREVRDGYGYEVSFKYPKDWYMKEGESHLKLSTVEDMTKPVLKNRALGIKTEPGATINIGLLENHSEKSYITLLEEIATEQIPGPGIITCIQNYRMNSRKFVGTCGLEKYSEKEVYIDLHNNISFTYSLLTITQEQWAGDENFSNTFYTIIDSVETKLIDKTDPTNK